MTENSTVVLRYLIELRKRLIHSLFFLVSLFLVLFYFSNPLYTLLAKPILKYLPHHQGLIATNIVAPFFVPFELTLVVSFFLAVPFFLYQLWAFIAPALYQNEKRLLWPLLLISTGLFYAGVAFAYFIIFPITFKFFIHAAPQGVLVVPDISLYLDFAVKMFLVFGIIFEVPILMLVLIWTNLITREQCIKVRSYAIVGAFVIGMLIAPPDVLSQTLLAIPLWLLFELGIVLSRYAFIFDRGDYSLSRRPADKPRDDD